MPSHPRSASSPAPPLARTWWRRVWTCRAAGGNVVTDALHFEGSLYQYGALAKQGLELRIVRPTGLAHRSRRPRQSHRLQNQAGRRIAGFDDQRLSARPEGRLRPGPFPRRQWFTRTPCRRSARSPSTCDASGMDFLACSSYKWLMGDMGLGIPLRSRGSAGSRPANPVRIPATDADGVSRFPLRPSRRRGHGLDAAPDAGGHFEVGTVSNTTAACLNYSLDYIMQLGVENIQAHRQPMLRRLQPRCRASASSR